MHMYTDVQLRALSQDEEVRDIILRTFLKQPIDINLILRWDGERPLEKMLQDPQKDIENRTIQDRLEIVLSEVTKFPEARKLLQINMQNIATRHGFSYISTVY